MALKESKVGFLEGRKVDGLSHEQKSAKLVIDQLCSYTHNPASHIFPVSWPVSLDESNMGRLATEQFVVAPKPFGPRSLFYADANGGMFLMNQARNVFKVDPSRVLQLIPNDTVLDGIVVAPGNASSNPNGTFFILDGIRVGGVDLTGMFIQDRISAVQTEIMLPRLDAVIDTDREIFQLDIAHYQPLPIMEKYLAPGQKDFPYPTRSFQKGSYIFHPLDENCTDSCKVRTILEWNELNNNCCFRLKIAPDEGQSSGELYVLGAKQQEVKYHSTIELTDKMQAMDGSIIECRYIDGCWTFVRLRTDLKHPNEHRTISGKWEKVEKPRVTREMILRSLPTSPYFVNLGFSNRPEFLGEFVGIDENVKFLGDQNVDGIRLSRNFDFVRGLQLRLGGFNRGPVNQFPASSPISLNKYNMKQLKAVRYVASPKPDGIRYLLYVDPDGRMFMEQENTQHVFIVDPDRAPRRIPKDTVLDGIMVKKIVRAEAASSNRNEAVEGKLTFVIMDASRVHGVDLTELNILDRISVVMDEIVRYRIPSVEADNVGEVFDVDITKYEDESAHMQQYLTQAFKEIYQYPLRGFVFNPLVGPYSCGGQGCRIYQWDEGNEIECAFRFKFGFWGELYVAGPMEDEEILYLSTIQLEEGLKEIDGSIVDCRYRDNRWNIVRVREDRSQPDSLRWISGKLEAYKKKVTLEELLVSLNG